MIPYCIGGGTSILLGKIGFACNQIISAKIITADGRLITASSENEPDLLWAIRGAGQLFGVVWELVLKTYPLSILGSPTGAHWAGQFIYPLESAERVCTTLEDIMKNEIHDTAGILMLMAPPPAFQPVLAVLTHYIGDPQNGPSAFRELADLQPMMSTSSTPLWPNISDDMDYACAKGDFKSFNLVGVLKFRTEDFLKVVDTYKELLTACPDAVATGYAFEWHTGTSKLPKQDSAFSHQDIMLWM